MRHTFGLKGKLYLLFLAVVLPMSVVVGYQVLSDIQRSKSMSASFPAYQLSQEANGRYKIFLNGVSDAVDSGKLSDQAISALKELVGSLKKEQPSESATETNAAERLNALYSAISADPAIGKLVSLKNEIRELGTMLAAREKEKQDHLSGVISDGEKAAHSQAMIVIAVLSLTLTLTAFFVRRLVNGLMTPLSYAIKMANNISAGNLANTITIKANNEIDSLLQALLSMNDKLVSIVSGVKKAADAVAASSDGLAKETQSVEQRALAQSSKIAHISGMIHEMSQSTSRVAQSANGAADAAAKTQEVVNEGNARTIKNLEVTQRVVQTVSGSSDKVAELSVAIRQIDEVTRVIKDVAGQTNLLALNAAIEAARAGEQGRGFAVVADEVRKLAERTTASTSDISRSVANVQQGTDEAVRAMAQVQLQVEEGAQNSSATANILQQIIASADHVTAMAKEIANVSHEQSIAGGEIAIEMEEISSISRENTESIQQVSGATEQLAITATELQRLVGLFKLI